MDAKKTVKGYSGPYRGKNDYYRDGAHILMFIVNFQAVVMALLTVALAIFLCTRHGSDRFFAETADGRTMQMESRSFPNTSTHALCAWAANTASDIMTFGFNDADMRFREHSRKYFTPEGWESFRKAMVASKLLESVEATQQIATAVPRAVPSALNEGLGANGKYQVSIDVPLLITFRAGSDIKPISKKVHMVIERMSTRENPSGVGISEWDIN
jgi:hypothetical protein